MSSRKYNIKKIIFSIVWVLLAVGSITLLISAVRHKENKYCKGVAITITGVNNNFFIDKADVYNIIKNYGGDSTQKKSLAAINLKLIEAELEKDLWIKNAELYFDNNNILKVSVEEREPIARLFTTTGYTYYIDSSCKVLPLSNKFSARLPIFTSFPTDVAILPTADSLLMVAVKDISSKIVADSFLMAIIDQIDILPNQTFEMIPKVGKQKILFGNAKDIDGKFKKLKLFYKNIIAQAGWNKYNIINLQYKDQVVATLRGAADITADSLKTLQLMQAIVANATINAADTSQTFVADSDKSNIDSSLIEQSLEREDEQADSTKKIVLIDLNKTNTNKTIIAPKTTILKQRTIPEKPPLIKPTAIALAKPATAVAVNLKPKIKPKIKSKLKPKIAIPKPVANEY